jgi:hypothetical protein
MLGLQRRVRRVSRRRPELRSEAGGTSPTRRAVLAATAAALPVLLAACKGMQSLGTPPPPAPDVVALKSAIAAEQVLVGRYAATLAYLGPRLAAKGSPAARALNADLTAIAAEHQEHLTQLRSRLVEPAGLKPSAAPSPSPSPSVITGSPGSVVRQLEGAEQAASDYLLGQVTRVPPALAQLMASISASEATHVPFLTAAIQAYNGEHS